MDCTDCSDEKEKRADKFALDMMIDDYVWKQILEADLDEEKIKNISLKNR